MQHFSFHLPSVGIKFPSSLAFASSSIHFRVLRFVLFEFQLKNHKKAERTNGREARDLKQMANER